MEHDTPIEPFVKFLPNKRYNAQIYLKDLYNFLQTMALTIKIVMSNLMVLTQQLMGDTMVFKLKWQLKIIMRFGYLVLDIH